MKKNLTTQKVTQALRAAGFQSMVLTGRNRRKGYKASQVNGRCVAIECCQIMDQYDALCDALHRAGLAASSPLKWARGMVAVRA